MVMQPYAKVTSKATSLEICLNAFKVIQDVYYRNYTYIERCLFLFILSLYLSS